MMNRRLPIALIFLVSAAFPAASAEAPADAVAQAGAEAAVTPYRDWLLDCRAACRLQTALRGTEGQLLLRVSLGAALAGLVVETPLPLHLPDGVTLAAGERPPLEVPWRTCGDGWCEARAALDAALVDGLRRERAASVTFTLVDGERVRLPVSLIGFTAGERALRAAVPRRLKRRPSGAACGRRAPAGGGRSRSRAVPRSLPGAPRSGRKRTRSPRPCRCR
jgi:invasion protein IalB